MIVPDVFRRTVGLEVEGPQVSRNRFERGVVLDEYVGQQR